MGAQIREEAAEPAPQEPQRVAALAPRGLLALQQSAGNRAVGSLLRQLARFPDFGDEDIQGLPGRRRGSLAGHHGSTLPHSEAEWLVNCVRIMGEENAAACREELFGPPPRAPTYQLDVTGATQQTTSQGTFYRFRSGNPHTNNTNRPQFQHPTSALQTYTGTGNNGSEQIHPAVAGPLNALMSALRAEGTRLNDESMKRAVVASAYRPPSASEGAAYLAALKKTIRLNSTRLPNAFPASLEAMAQSELGFSGSAAHNRFRDAVAAAPGWNAAQAAFLVSETGQFKAPRGGSTHHSGVVVDIDFPYAVASGTVQNHGMNRERNADAFLSAAGQWLNRYAPDFGFDTYNTSKEIWHQEWRDWRGTAADPSQATSTTP